MDLTPVVFLIAAMVLAAAVLVLALPVAEPPAPAAEERPPLITQPYEAGATVEQPTPYFAAPVPESPDPLEVAANLDKKALVAIAMFGGVLVMSLAYFAFSVVGSDTLLTRAAQRHLQETIGNQPPPRVDPGDPAGHRGAYVYASLCFDCHGKRGEGLVGLTLNKPDFRATCDFYGNQAQPDKPCKKGTQPGLPQGPDDTKVYDFISKTVARGRPRPAPAISMPAWSRDEGGPLNAEQIRQVVTFIMFGNWDEPLRVREEEAEELRRQANRETDPNKRAELMKQAEVRLEPHPPAPPTAQSPEEQAKAITGSLCFACHSFEKGKTSPNPLAPNLGAYGAEGPFTDQLKALKASGDPKWLQKWISDAPAIKPGTLMPAWKGQLSEQQIDIVAEYLLGLK